MTQTKKATKNVPLKAELHRELKLYAVGHERDLSDVLEEAVREYLRNVRQNKTGLDVKSSEQPELSSQ